MKLPNSLSQKGREHLICADHDYLQSIRDTLQNVESMFKDNPPITLYAAGVTFDKTASMASKLGYATTMRRQDFISTSTDIYCKQNLASD